MRPNSLNKLYRSNTKPNNPLIEKQANFFAAALLMPKVLIKKKVGELKESLPYDDKLIHLADMFQVSNQAMDYRLKSLGYYDYGF